MNYDNYSAEEISNVIRTLIDSGEHFDLIYALKRAKILELDGEDILFQLKDKLIPLFESQNLLLREAIALSLGRVGLRRPDMVKDFAILLDSENSNTLVTAIWCIGYCGPNGHHLGPKLLEIENRVGNSDIVIKKLLVTLGRIKYEPARKMMFRYFASTQFCIEARRGIEELDAED